MEQTPFAEAPLSDATPDALQSVYLTRLQRLLRLRRRHEHELNGQGIRLLDRSIFAAFCDCIEVGAEEKGRSILRSANFPIDDGPVQDPRAAA
jgi:hypothetical protein